MLRRSVQESLAAEVERLQAELGEMQQDAGTTDMEKEMHDAVKRDVLGPIRRIAETWRTVSGAAAQGTAAKTRTAEPRKRPSGRRSAARRRARRSSRAWRWSHAAPLKGASTACTCSASGEQNNRQLGTRPKRRSAKATPGSACLASAPSRSRGRMRRRVQRRIDVKFWV